MIAGIPLMNQNRSIADLETQNPELRFESGIFEPRTQNSDLRVESLNPEQNQQRIFTRQAGR